MRAFSLIAVAAAVAVVVPDVAAVRALERAALRVGGEAALTVAGAASATPSIAAVGSRVAVAWGARVPDGATDVYVAMSADGGRTFAAPVRVNDRAGTARVGGELPPRVAITGDVVTVLWTARAEATSIRIARSDDAGRTFGPSRELQRSGAAGDRGWPALTADAKGRVHAIWLDHRGMAPEPQSTGAHHGHDRSAAAAADGAAMAQKSGLFYSDLRGERELTRGVCYCCKTALAAAGEGAIVAAWRHVYPGNIRDIAFTMSRDGGRSFAAPVRVSEDGWQIEGCPDDGPALAVDARRTVHIVWPTVTAAPEPHKAIFYASTSDGRAFAPRVRVSPLGHNTAHPQIAVDEAGMVWVLWDEIVSGRRRVFVAARQEDGAFDAARALSGDAAAASYPVAAAADGALVAAWVEGEPSASRIEVRRLASPRSSAAPQVPPR